MNWSDITSTLEEFFNFEINVAEIEINVSRLLFFVLALIVAVVLAKIISRFFAKRLLTKLPIKETTAKHTKRITQLVIFAVAVIGALAILGFQLTALKSLFAILNTPINLGKISISINDVVIFIILITATFYFAKFMSNLLMTKALARVQMDKGTRYVLKRVTEYAIIAIGALAAFQMVGINLSGLAVIFGLLSVGIGFGLQNIASNFISGIILLFERPIRVGDRVTVGDIQGDVDEINIRATIIRSLDNISIIVPNNEFIEGRVINWSHGDPKVRMNIDVGVSYNSDLDNVLTALREVAEENDKVLKTPRPEVLLMEFGDSSWNMQLRLWIADPQDYYRTLSAINCAIVRKFRDMSIEIPFPQRDLHVRSPLPVPFDTAKN